MPNQLFHPVNTKICESDTPEYGAKDQNLSLQLDALRQEGCQIIYQEKVSGAKAERPELRRMIDQLREGDLIVIWKLDRLGRSLRDLVNLVTEIQDKGPGLKSLNDSIDTTTPHGKLTFHLFAALAEFERDIIRERTMAGLAAARARGRRGGRPPGLSKEAKDRLLSLRRSINKAGIRMAGSGCGRLPRSAGIWGFVGLRFISICGFVGWGLGSESCLQII